MKLTPRLEKTASLIPRDSRLADIGADHANLCIYCVLNGIARHAIATDVNVGPLLRAEKNVKKHGLEKSIDLRLSDGLAGLSPGEADAVVIAGMGGLLIQKIISSGADKLAGGTLLLLQPMNALSELRTFLYSEGFGIENEYLACEGDKIYNIISARVGAAGAFDESDIFVGRNIRKNCPELFKVYALKKISVLQKITDGMQMSARNLDVSGAEHEKRLFSEALEEALKGEN